ncbi:hypothetical protein Ddc_22002 [Ditylenchus destructor]|nr:hypothetical protein Ddc_22002 [Ditylenchus destructor]
MALAILHSDSIGYLLGLVNRLISREASYQSINLDNGVLYNRSNLVLLLVLIVMTTCLMETKTYPDSIYPVPTVVSGGVTTRATDALLPKSPRLISSTNDDHSGENSSDESGSIWRIDLKSQVHQRSHHSIRRHLVNIKFQLHSPSQSRDTIGGASPQVLGFAAALKNTIEVSQPTLQIINEALQNIRASTRSPGMPSRSLQLYQTRSHSVSLFAVRNRNKSYQKQPEPQGEHTDLFHADKSPVTSVGVLPSLLMSSAQCECSSVAAA